MLPDLTPAAARTLQAAQEWARRTGDATVLPSHILASLLDEEEGQAAQALLRAGFSLEVLRQLFAPKGAAAPASTPSAEPLALDDRTWQTLVRAREIAAGQSGDRTVTTAQLLIAIFQTDPKVPTTLRGFDPTGRTLNRLEEEVLGPSGPPLRLEEPLTLSEPTEQIDTARILDASANRAREALRVLEDYTRFALDDAFLSRELKHLRHDLTQALAGFSVVRLATARDTLQDVGTTIKTEAEQRRHSVLDVACANCKRLQEALRSLEEFGKLQSTELGQDLEKLRYRSYTLERALLLGADSRQRLADARLYVLLTGAQCTAALDWTIQEAAAGGAQLFQLREKSLSDRQLLERARQVRRWTRAAGTLFIMNDRPDIARLVDADGVHVGQDELPVKEVRRIVGPDALIGVSTHNLDQVRRAILDGASYLGVGPTFPSGTKSFEEFPGLEFVRQVAGETSLPSFVIGGVNLETIGAAVAAGARRVAVSQAICQADDPRQVAVEIRHALEASP